ncbi:MAG: hypothetical protein WCJ57_02435 [Candidatus Falkowbacteria bacterium]
MKASLNNDNNFQEQGDVALISQRLNESLCSVLEKKSEINDNQKNIHKANMFSELMAAQKEEMKEFHEAFNRIIKNDHLETHMALEYLEPCLAENDDREDFSTSNDSSIDYFSQTAEKNQSLFKKFIDLFRF